MENILAKENITSRIYKIAEKTELFEIYFVVNVAEKTEFIDYSHSEQSILTEYLTEEEYDVMITALKECKFNVKLFNNEKDFIQFIFQNEKNIDFEHVIVFNLARNGKGLNKKALIPSFCQLYNIKHTGSGAYNVCLGRHKFHTNCILQSKGLPVPQTWYYTDGGWLLNKIPPQNIELIIKPSFESASRGITEDSIVSYCEESQKHIENLQYQYEQNIIVQEFICGYEVQVPIIKFDGQILPLMAVGININDNPLLSNQIITYNVAYDETYNFYNFADIDSVLANEIMRTAAEACAVLNLEHYCRFDFRIDLKGNFFITDISTHPFLIKHSAFAFAFSSFGLAYKDIFLTLIELIAEEGT